MRTTNRKRARSGANASSTGLELDRGRTDNILEIHRETDDEAKEKALARAALRPTINGADTIRRIAKKSLGDLHLMSLVDELQLQADAAVEGDLGRGEAMLMVQAHTLDKLFNELTRLGVLNIGEYLSAAETFFKLALRAQTQCRSTLETLAQIKNPSAVAFVRQANISTGPQQVNNGGGSGVPVPVRAPARAGENQIPPNKLLEQTHGERLEFGAQGQASGVNSRLEAVGAVNGTTNARG